MKSLSTLFCLFGVFGSISGATFFHAPFPPPPPAPDFTVTTSDGQVKQLYQDYINQQKLVVIEAFFTTCPPCATHAPLLQNLYSEMQATHPGKVEFILLSTLITDTNVKVAQYKTSKNLTMPAVGKDGGSITALQPYINGQFGPFQGTPTFIVIAPGSGAVFFDIRGNTPTQTIDLLRQKIDEIIPKQCSLTNPFGSPLEEVSLDLRAAAYDTTIIANGQYSLSNLSAIHNIPYQVKPSKTGAPEGLTTYDLVLISKHILSLEPLLCPWQLIAADVNCSGSVTTFDIVSARKVILGIVDTFPCGAWRFIPDSASLSGGNCQDFTGVRLGDVNAGPCNDSLAGPTSSRGPTQYLSFRDKAIQQGETTSITFFSGGTERFDGFQCSFEFNPDYLNINKLASETLTGFDAENYNLSRGNLRISWTNPGNQIAPTGSSILTMEITPSKSGKLSELLQLSQANLAPELYVEGQARPLQLSALANNPACLIWPNPSNGQFTLQFMADTPEDIFVQMTDVQGKLVFENTYPAIKGMNSLEIDPSLTSTGVYFLKVDGKAVGKVVVK